MGRTVAVSRSMGTGMAVARDKRAANTGPDHDRDGDPQNESEASKRRKPGPGRQTLAQHLPHITVQHDVAAVEPIHRAVPGKGEGLDDVHTMKCQGTAARQAATSK